MQHDQIISNLEERLKGFCSIVETRGEYKFKASDNRFRCDSLGYVNGEFDIVGIHNNNILIFEVKTRDTVDSRLKELYQLDKDTEYFSRYCQDLSVKKFVAYSYKNKRGYDVERIL
jgi:hypothetical protein